MFEVIKFVIFELQLKLNTNDKKNDISMATDFFILVTVYFYD